MKIILTLWLLIGLWVTSHANTPIERWSTPEGATVLFVQTKGLPMLDIALNFGAGSATDGKQFGLAALTNTLLSTNTQYRSKEQIIKSFEELGVQFSSYVSKDIGVLSMRTLTHKDKLTKALKLLTEVVTKPVFKQRYLSYEKNHTLHLIKADEQYANATSALAFNKLVFANHPYGHSLKGNKESIASITLSDLQRYYQTYYVASNLNIALVGDISKAKAKQIARQITHHLAIGKKVADNPMVKPLNAPIVQHIEFPFTQTHLRIGQVGINYTHADYYPLYLGNHILGVGMNSILSNEIRVKKGLAYSVTSFLNRLKSNGAFFIRLQTKNNQAQQVKTIAIKILKDFISQPINNEKLQDGKDNIIGGFALQTASNTDILYYLSIIGFYQLPLDYLTSFTNNIKHISAHQIHAAFKRLIKPDKLIIISVGKFK